MTKVSIYTKDNITFGFESKDHATGIDEYEEIVCNGVSALTQTLYFSLLEVCGLDENKIYDYQEDGYLKVMIEDEAYLREDVKTLFSSMELGLRLISKQFPINLEVIKLEVQND